MNFRKLFCLAPTAAAIFCTEMFFGFACGAEAVADNPFDSGNGFVAVGLVAAAKDESADAKSATEPGHYELYSPFDETLNPALEILRKGQQEGTADFAVIRWPATSARPSVEHRIALSEGGGKYVLAWQPNAGAIWIADKNTLRTVNVDDPEQIRTGIFGRNNNGGWGEIPKAVLAELEKVYPIGRKDGSIGGNFGGQTIESAVTSPEWQVEGVITDPNGKPLPGALVAVTTEYKPMEVIASTTTDAEGKYVVWFRTDLETLSKFRGASLDVTAPFVRDQKYAANGSLRLLLRDGELAKHEGNAHDVVLNVPAQVDFRLHSAN